VLPRVPTSTAGSEASGLGKGEGLLAFVASPAAGFFRIFGRDRRPSTSIANTARQAPINSMASAIRDQRSEAGSLEAAEIAPLTSPMIFGVAVGGDVGCVVVPDVGCVVVPGVGVGGCATPGAVPAGVAFGAGFDD
jgi:hypothetical protein